MSGSGHTEAQMLWALKQLESGRKAEDVARAVGMFEAHDLCREGEVRRRGCEPSAGGEQLRDENTRLRKGVADLSADKDALQRVVETNGWGSRSWRPLGRYERSTSSANGECAAW